jgi:archaemetzincin
MAVIHLVSLAHPFSHHLKYLQEEIHRQTGLETVVLPESPDIGYAYDTVRQQYHSSQILLGLKKQLPAVGDFILGITHFDLFIPILTYVFGEAQLKGPAGVVSSFRLLPELYGLPKNDDLVLSRLGKEAVHELGHNFGLRHCAQYDCVMHASTYAEEIDLKESAYCSECRRTIENERSLAAQSNP